MHTKIIKALLRIYFYIVGASFYLTEFEKVDLTNKSLNIGFTSHENISFYFYKKNINFFYTQFGTMHKKVKHVYIVSAVYAESMPEQLRNFNDIRLYVRNSILRYINNDDLIFEFLMIMYIKCLIKELEKT